MIPTSFENAAEFLNCTSAGGKLDKVSSRIADQLSHASVLDRDQLKKLHDCLSKAITGIKERFNKLPPILRNIAHSYSENLGAIKKANKVMERIFQLQKSCKPIEVDKTNHDLLETFNREFKDIRTPEGKVRLTIEYLVNERTKLDDNAINAIKLKLIDLINDGSADDLMVLLYLGNEKPDEALSRVFPSISKDLLEPLKHRLKEIFSSGTYEEKLKLLLNKTLLVNTFTFYKEDFAQFRFLTEIKSGIFDADIDRIINGLSSIEREKLISSSQGNFDILNKSISTRIQEILTSGTHDKKVNLLKNNELILRILLINSELFNKLPIFDEIKLGKFDNDIYRIIKQLHLTHKSNLFSFSQDDNFNKLHQSFFDRITALINGNTEEELATLIKDNELPQEILNLATLKKQENAEKANLEKQEIAEKRELACQDEKIKEIKAKIDAGNWETALALYTEYSNLEKQNRVSEEAIKYAENSLAKFIKHDLKKMDMASYENCYTQLIAVPSLKIRAEKQNATLSKKLVSINNYNNVPNLCKIVKAAANKPDGSWICQFRDLALIRLMKIVMAAEFISEDDLKNINELDDGNLKSKIKIYELKTQIKQDVANLKIDEASFNVDCSDVINHKKRWNAYFDLFESTRSLIIIEHATQSFLAHITAGKMDKMVLAYGTSLKAREPHVPQEIHDAIVIKASAIVNQTNTINVKNVEKAFKEDFNF